MRRLEEYIVAGKKRLRCGYTTGTCAAAAARAAVDLLLSGDCPPSVVVSTPADIGVVVDVEEARRDAGWARCTVRKDAGDDPDVTDGIAVLATVTLQEQPGVLIDGGEGVGRVTKAGLDQPVGEAAINSVPRAMIREAVLDSAREHGYGGGFKVLVSIPEGIELAARTFNPRLGIEGGISVLGTTGIVRPMSEDALVASIRLELNVLREAAAEHVLVMPGNYGRAFAETELGLSVEHAVLCSNYVGATIDEAARLGFGSMLLVGHAGKLVKVAGGAMNTHSRVADGRAETMAAHAAMAGASADVVRMLMDAPTTDAMVDLLADHGLLEKTMESIMVRMAQLLAHRAGNRLRVEAIVFSNAYGLLGKTAGADELCHLSRGVLPLERCQSRGSTPLERVSDE